MTKNSRYRPEYAYRPSPRLTTSVITKGQVIRKIQQDLDAPVATLEEKVVVEDLLRKQHMEVLGIIGEKNFSTDLTVHEKPKLDTENLTAHDRLVKIDGVVRVYQIDNDGNFISDKITTEFKKVFDNVFKSLPEILDIFSFLPGGIREKGVVEIECNRLYFVSNGIDRFFVLTLRTSAKKSWEERIQAVLPA